jgi:hypothetical protein
MKILLFSDIVFLGEMQYLLASPINCNVGPWNLWLNSYEYKRVLFRKTIHYMFFFEFIWIYRLFFIFKNSLHVFL